MSIVTVERSDQVAAREAISSMHATYARDAEQVAHAAAERAARLLGNGDGDMASAWVKQAIEAAGTAHGHAYRAEQAHPGSLEARSARLAARRAEEHAQRAVALGVRD